MLNFHGFSAWVCIDGIRRDGNGTPEYDIEVSEADKTVTCWIASELGKNFSVHWKTSTYQGDTGGYVKMDGVSCAGKILRAHPLPRDTYKEGVKEGQTLRRFAFSSLSLTDDDAYLGAPSQTLPDLGVIDLDIYPIRVNGSKRRATTQQTNLATLKVHERSKKAVTQQVTLTKAEYLSKPSSYSDVTLTGPAFVKFRFKYRPMDVLRANGIAPQAPKAKVPTPPPETQKENKPLVKHEKKDVKKSKVKREADGDVIDLTEDTSRPKNKKVKLENFVQGEVIDLT
ncbi:hypothetical protein R3P38DRAFT_3214909 [Favolaschia claudopus]|uniref:DUF7918 domain-containing protein n=1 Tax=Favolaschia claudopus TaxID=2862362 RepID=A0AAW0AAX7_9AGAR